MSIQMDIHKKGKGEKGKEERGKGEERGGKNEGGNAVGRQVRASASFRPRTPVAGACVIISHPTDPRGEERRSKAERQVVVWAGVTWATEGIQ
jgi:hypothetical protein